MRTGAIFARGSCRALKWMALFGVVFALGAGSAFAQATFTGAEWTPESNVLKINMSAAVWSRSPNDAAEDFEVTWGTGADEMEATGTASTIPGARGDAATEFTITLDKVIPTGAGGADGQTGITVAYTAPTEIADVNDRGILDNSAAHEPTATAASITVTENTTIAPTVPAVEAMMFRNGVEIDAFQLPAAMGNQPFTYLPSNLPPGLMWDADGDDDTAGGTGVNADRQIEGTPSAVTDGAHMVTYTVTDRDGQATSITFMITVNDIPATPDMPTATPTTNTAGSLDVMWDAPADNNSAILYYQVQHKATADTAWMVPPTNVLNGTSLTVPELTDGTSYDFQVRAINGVGMSAWSATGMGTPMASAAVPAAPAAPTVTTGSARGSLDVMWVAPADNGSAIIDYSLQYRVKDAANWTVMTTAITGTSTTLSGMPDNTTYEVQVRARNVNGSSPWSPSGEGATAAAPAVPDAPAMPTVTATANTRGSLDVMWVAPADNGSTIMDYSLQYRVKGTPNWTVMTAAIVGTSTTLSGMPDGTTYEVQVRARNANGMSEWSPSGEGTTMAAPVLPDLKGQITSMKLTGGVTTKNIGGANRVHVTEGATDVELEVTVQWTHEEITALYGAATTADPAIIDVQIRGNLTSHQTSTLPNWVSWIDDGQDAHFPDAGDWYDGASTGRLRVKIPKKPKATEFPYSPREVRSSTASISLLILEDDSEAENDAFYVQTVRSPDVDLNAGSAVNRVTPIVVIEDNDEQKVTVKKGTSSGPTKVYENADTDFTIAASPARVDLPLDVRLDMLDLSGVTVSAAKISLSTAAVTLNADRSGSTAGNSASVTVHLPASDGDREDNHYDLQASVVLYSLSAGGYEPIAVASHKIDVVDIHKLPPLMVDPASGMVDEGGEIELTLTVDRNPHDTIATAGAETRQYTSEALTIAVTAGGTASGADYTMTPSAITVDAHNKRAPWTQDVKVKIAAAEDEDIDAETLMLDFVVMGTVAANGPRPDDAPAYDAQASLTIQDATTAMVSVRENAYDVIQAALGTPPSLMTGMSGELMGANLFDYDSSAVTVAYGTSVEGGAVTASASGGTVTIMGAMAGEAKVTITATATSNSSSLIVNQTKANVAQLTFPVMVEDEPLTFTVKGPDDMNLVEGGMGGMVTVMTNRPVSENTEVMLMRDGSSSASDADFELDPPLVTIMANQKEGHTMVMAVEDDMMENADNMPEMLTLFLVVDGMQMTGEDQSVSFYLWDAAVPALPIIAHLLLAAFLAVGGYRRYLRR